MINVPNHKYTVSISIFAGTEQEVLDAARTAYQMLLINRRQLSGITHIVSAHYVLEMNYDPDMTEEKWTALLEERIENA